MGKQPHNWLQDFDIAVEILCPCLALSVVALRVYARWSTKAFGWGMFKEEVRRTNGYYHRSHDTDRTPQNTYRHSHVKGGGNSIGLKSFTDSRTFTRTAERDSDEEVLTPQHGQGIQRVIQISVTHEDEARNGAGMHGAQASGSNFSY